jgi:tRNA threonylcarbamoyladenosine biosynthesis protein TsaB
MIILAADTATQSCGVAICDGETLIGEITTVRNQTHSRHLMPMIHSLLDMTGVQLTGVEGFAVCQGPGSFTGLRIGISAVKGLALALDKPLIGVSGLDALAWPLCLSSVPVCALIDARKGEIYCSRYQFEQGRLKEKTPEQVMTPARFLETLTAPSIFVGNGAELYQGMIRESLGSRFQPLPKGSHMIRAYTVAALAARRFKQGDADNVFTFAPAYIRRSDAEIHLTRKNVNDSDAVRPGSTP